MIDFRACRIAGALKIPKCRAIWHQGKLTVWRVKNRKPYFHAEIECSEPVRQSPVKRRWNAQTTDGKGVMLIGECWACGGHWPLAKVPARELFNVR